MDANSTSLVQQRQQEMINLLLAENAYLKRMLATLLPGGDGLTEGEIRHLQVMIENTELQISNHKPVEGNNVMNISNSDLTKGNNAMNISNGDFVEGNNATNISFHYLMEGNKEPADANWEPENARHEQQLAIVKANVQALMKKAIVSSHLTTAKILLQLAVNPATPLATLRKLTGLSFDGMAKRIMAMKRADLIVRLSAPKRYLLTEKAKALFVEKKEIKKPALLVQRMQEIN